MDDIFTPTGKPQPKKFELINGVFWAKKEVKRAKKTPGTALGDAQVAAQAAKAAASGAGGDDFSTPDAGEGNLNPLYAPVASKLSVEERYELCRGVAVECIQVCRPGAAEITAHAASALPCLQEDELRALLARKTHPVCYDGFEPSGRMHIAQGILKALIVRVRAPARHVPEGTGRALAAMAALH